MLYIWLQACLLGDVGVIGCISKVIVPIKQLWLCVSYSDFLTSQIIRTCRHLCNLAIFFTHNTQYSLQLLIHVHVQCDLAIARFTCVNICSLNCFNFFLKYKIGLTCFVYVFVFGIYVLKIVVERWFWELNMLIGSLVELHTWLHSYLCFFLLEKLLLSNLDTFLDTSSTPGYLSSS